MPSILKYVGKDAHFRIHLLKVEDSQQVLDLIFYLSQNKSCSSDPTTNSEITNFHKYVNKKMGFVVLELVVWSGEQDTNFKSYFCPETSTGNMGKIYFLIF